MAKINILPAKVYNRIAAGEVVDRPYSVVKELVENAIDAGATEIEVHVEQGGKQLIRVVDNGCGIERADLQSAFMPHATSKIAKAEDLENILTLGFRGEAVASIASVSKMTITSKVKGEKCYALTSNGGELGNITEAVGYDGTEVRVEMLFFNAPVRLKFLKSDKAEEADITTFVSRFILSRPDIAFTYYANGKKVLQSFGGGDEEALVCVYGAATRAQCIEINALKHGVRIRGFIGNQNFSKPNKSYQSVFLNGRYVLNSTVSAAITGAYSSYLMKRQYPFYVLHIDMPPEIVDVNVHPNKADVRFADNNIVYGCIYSVISAVLDGKAQALDYIVSAPAEEPAEEPQSSIPAEEPTPTPAPKKSLSESILEQAKKEEEEKKDEQTRIGAFGASSVTYEQARKEMAGTLPHFKRDDSKGIIDTSNAPPMKMISRAELEKRERRLKKPNPERLLKLFPNAYYKPEVWELDDPAYEKAKEDGTEKDYFEENKRLLEQKEKEEKQSKIDVSTCKYAGKLFNTYLLYESGDDIFVIDQHAAHERLIFDRLKARMEKRDAARQPMLLPYEIKLNAFEATFIRERMQDIIDMGFDIEETEENVFIVTAIPVDLPKIDIGAFFNQILGDVGGFRAIKIAEILKDKLASAACKAAVKGGMDLTQEEINDLFKQMDGDMGLKCPHGRPVVVKVTRTQLEKAFKRIV